MLAERLNHLANSAKLTKLSSSTRYRICVLGLGNWISASPSSLSSSSTSLLPLPSSSAAATVSLTENGNKGADDDDRDGNKDNANGIFSNEFRHQMRAEIETDGFAELPDELLKLFTDSTISRCTEVRTLDATPSLITDENGLSSHGIIHSILTRRLGLIVGCCLGIIVFIVLISVLGYLKLKKQRIENAKRQQPIPPEYISYRHFSIPQEERDHPHHLHHHHHHHHLQQQQQQAPLKDGCMSNHPTFISGAVLGTTTTTTITC